MLKKLLYKIGLLKVPNLPPLPQHAPHGLQVKKGDTLTITDFRISLHDLGEEQSKRGEPFRMALPPGADNYKSGASFGLKRRLHPSRFNVDDDLVLIDDDERTIHVLLHNSTVDPFNPAYEIAERVLDILSVQSFTKSELDDPLRDYALWFRSNGITTLRCVTTGKLGVRIRSTAEVRNPSGEPRLQPQAAPIRWHASFAYFRRSQLTDELHDAYRYLFLALEALLSEVYPWQSAVGENRWLKDALRHVMEGYNLSLNEFLVTPGGNPYRRFLKEQYSARRCALFHSKVREGATVPGDISGRAELSTATQKLGRLYVRLAQLITGVQFGGGAMSTAAFARMMDSVEGNDLYVCHTEQFDREGIEVAPGILLRQVNGQLGLYQQVGKWNVNSLSATRVHRVGSLISKDGERVEILVAQVDITLDGIDILEIVLQTELGNADHLREWFL